MELRFRGVDEKYNKTGIADSFPISLMQSGARPPRTQGKQDFRKDGMRNEEIGIMVVQCVRARAQPNRNRALTKGGPKEVVHTF